VGGVNAVREALAEMYSELLTQTVLYVRAMVWYCN
jgi:hypothetical protein